MRLTNYTDYALRVLIYLALKKEDELSTIKEIADTYQISKNHLMKIIHELGVMGYIETIRGRNGGIRLLMEPKDINIGELVMKTEEDFHLVECFHKTKEGEGAGANHCIISPACRLKHVLHESLLAFVNVLKGYTLADLLENKADLKSLL